MELAQLLVTPGTLLTAFIFFWKQSKAISNELKREIASVRDEVSAVRVEMHDMNGPWPRRRPADDPGSWKIAPCVVCIHTRCKCRNP